MILKCPDSNLSMEDRIIYLLNNIEEWINLKPLKELVALFGGISDNNVNYITYLNEFVEVWNYRAALQDKNERWNIYDDEFVDKNKRTIMACVKELGLVDSSVPRSSADYILPLGGARFSNLYRTQYAHEAYNEIRKKDSTKKIQVIALSGTRMINEKERYAVDTYAKGAETEYDAICKGLESAFEISDSYQEDVKDDCNINLCSRVRHYETESEYQEIWSLAAPSNDPKRRANSRDTFEFFLKYFKIKKGDSILLVTSQIYVPYQLMKFMDLAIDGEFNVDCIGYAMDTKEALARPSNFLQEVKGAVNAMYGLWCKYSNYKL